MQRSSKPNREGAVAVEFAFVAPVLLALVLGVVEVNRMYDTQNLLATAAREGARFASMDRDGLVPDGMTANEKMVEDVKTMLESNGYERDDISVEIRHADNPEQEFDIDDPANELELFTVDVSIDYSSVSYMSVDSGSDYPLTGSVTFRNGRATISD
ncbi:MAG: TadE family protein [Planctomycetota bacterium]